MTSFELVFTSFQQVFIGFELVLSGFQQVFMPGQPVQRCYFEVNFNFAPASPAGPCKDVISRLTLTSTSPWPGSAWPAGPCKDVNLRLTLTLLWPGRPARFHMFSAGFCRFSARLHRF